MNVKSVFRRLLLSLTVFILLAPPGQMPAQAGNPTGTIAYVRPNQTDGDQIHLIEPDHTGDRKIFSTGKPLPALLKGIERLDWKPNASELAFASSHEDACSVFETDLYTIHPDGSNYRRITNPPACASRAGLPTGTVKVPVENNMNVNGPFTFYFQGAPGPIEIALAPGTSTTLTFNNVLDFASNQDQYAVWMYGDVRAPYPGAQVDVKAGSTVTTGVLEMNGGFEHFGYAWPEYTPDGSTLYSIREVSYLFKVPSTNQIPGELGDQVNFDMTIRADHLAWGPTAQRANQFLFRGWITDSSYTSRFPIMLGNINNSTPQMLVDVDPTDIGRYLLGLTWLPDGSGFLYSVTEMVNYDDRANIWEYSFATGQSKRVTNVPFGFAREITVSPDGHLILFELQPSGFWLDENPPIDLYMVNRDGSGLTQFLGNARSPAWSPQAIPQNYPLPVLTAINPGSAVAGGAGFTLTASGSSFVNGSVVRWNGVDLTTTFVNSTTLTAQVPAGKITAAATANVTVYNPAPGGGESGAKIFTINSAPNPVPGLTSLNPSEVSAGGPGFTLTVSGSNFVNGAVVRWNGAALPTTYVSATALTAQVTAAQIAAIGPVSVTVFNPAPGGGLSGALALSIVNPAPTLTSLSPGLIKAGGAAFTLTVNGSGLMSASVVRWNGTDLATTYFSPSKLTAQVPADRITTAGTANVTVYSPSPGGGESQPLTLTISAQLHSVFLPTIIR